MHEAGLWHEVAGAERKEGVIYSAGLYIDAHLQLRCLQIEVKLSNTMGIQLSMLFIFMFSK